MTNEYHSHETAKRVYIPQVVEHLLPQLPYHNLGPALWSLRVLSCIGEVRAVEWILDYCKPTIICYENVDVQCAQPLDAAKIEAGDVIVLVGQDVPRKNGVYVYTGMGGPLLK